MEGKTIQVTENSELCEALTVIAQSTEPVELCFEFQKLKFVVKTELVDVNPPQ